MSPFPYIDVQYFVVHTYELVSGGVAQVNTPELPDQLYFWAGQLALLGMTVSIIMLGLLVYFKIRLIVTEHEVLHEQEEQARTHDQPPELSVKNARWQQVVELASSGDEGSWRRAIMDADVMLGELLVEQGYQGETIGDQLKLANPLQFATLDIAWQAHKMRNALAHMGEAFPLSERDVRATIDQYARVFEEFGII